MSQPFMFPYQGRWNPPRLISWNNTVTLFLPLVTIKYVTTKQSLTKGFTELNKLGEQQQNISKLNLETASLEKSIYGYISVYMNVTKLFQTKYLNEGFRP